MITATGQLASAAPAAYVVKVNSTSLVLSRRGSRCCCYRDGSTNSVQATSCRDGRDVATDAGLSSRRCALLSLPGAVLLLSSHVASASEGAVDEDLLPSRCTSSYSSQTATCIGQVDGALGSCAGVCSRECRSSFDDRPPYFLAPWEYDQFSRLHQEEAVVP